MIRTLAVVTLIAALAAPVLAADPPMVINMPSASKATADAPKQTEQAKPAGELPKVVNYPSGSDGTMPPPKPATDAAKSTTATVAVMAIPSVYSVSDASAMNAYAGLSADYSMSMFGGPTYLNAGFPIPSYAAATMTGAAFFGSLPPSAGYFYTFAPPAVIYRDITSTPLGKTAYFSPDGTVIENPPGYMGFAGAAMILR